MKTLDKIILLVSVVLLVGSTAVWASGNADSSTDGEAKEIRFFTWDDASGMALWSDVLDEFNEQENPDFTVKLENASYGEYWQKLQTGFAAGTAPDVFLINPDFLAVFAKKNALYDLSPLIDRDENYSTDQFFDSVIEPYFMDGSLYVLPKDMAPSVLFYNADMFLEAGLKTPYEYYEDGDWTWETFLDCCRELSDEGSKTYGVTFETMWHRALQWVWQNDGEAFDRLVDPSRCLLDSPDAVAGYQFAADLINVEGVSPSPRLTRTQSSTELFMAGKVGMDINGAWMIPAYRGIDAFDWDIAPLPEGKREGDITGGSGPAIFSGTENVEEAWQVAKFFAGYDAQRIFADAGYIVPTNQDVFQSEHFIESDMSPSHKDVFLDVLDYAQIPVLTGEYMEIDSLIQNVLDLVWVGEMTAEEAFRSVVPEVDALLKQ